jgi:hypothetical protein
MGSRQLAVVVSFPASRIVRRPTKQPSPRMGEQMDRVAELLAQRARKVMSDWEQAEGRPNEISLITARLSVLCSEPAHITKRQRNRLLGVLRALEGRHD